MTTDTIQPAAWRVSMGATADRNYWHYFGKKPKTIDDGEIWEPLYSASTLESLQRENDTLRRAQSYTYIGRDGKSVLARDLEDRAEAAEAEVKRLQAEIDRKSSMPGDHRYWEGRYRDEAAENDRLRGILFKCGSFIADRYQEGDAEYQVVLLVNDAICRNPALASTGGEHNGN